MECFAIPVQIYLMRKFSLVAVVIIVCFSPHASSDVELTSNQRKYITKSYFGRHDNFIDSLFDNFMANDFPLGLSKVLKDKSFGVPSASVLHRHVIGQGSHRHLSLSIRLNMQPDLKSHLAGDSCEVIIIERLPSGVFADPFELQHLVHRGVFTEAAVFGDANLELPSFRSNQSVVEIHIDVASKMLPMNEEDLQVNVEIPIHARYPPLGQGYWRVMFGQTNLLFCCNIEKSPCLSCLLMPSENNAHTDGGPVAWEIPCGIKEHAGIVSAVTFGFAIVVALLIVQASIWYSNSNLS